MMKKQQEKVEQHISNEIADMIQSIILNKILEESYNDLFKENA